MKYIAKLAFVFAAVSLSAFATETENVRFRVIRAPGAVNVDADSSDWDLSGSIFCCLDVGRITGDPSGAFSVERIYWSNKATALMSDRPTQAGVEPRLWGKAKVE
jgi:hypothetical protein